MKPLKSILLIDDDETTNFLNHRLLSRMETAEQINVVTNGEEALDYINQVCTVTQADTTAQCPELILLDIKMPVMDGFEFLDELQRVYDSFTSRPVVLMLSSSASFYDLERIKAYSVVKKHYSKPLKEADVKEIFQEYFPKNLS
ncbi:MAG: response regulator [Hymenobacteraceae bacterium]|nr:response regulator [Hymenobacteraceae bacterium]MDX5394837.1 response regulator [Hymenobacteraceae bacterium]MDX5443238.1 response regulator [Hymenobacteraceae bacterium]MDX5510871.1 response regulator [Hymenobacteraceae bacterium]